MKNLAATLLALAVAGCVDIDHEFTLNPDGSGKVAIVTVSSPVNLDFTEKDPSPEKSMMKAVREELEKSEGVDAWADVSATLRDDGKMLFKATAYFKDFSQLKLHSRGQTGPLPSLTMKKDAAGNWVIEAVADLKEADAPAPPPAKPTEEEIKNKIRAERAKYQQMKPLMETFLKDSRYKARVNLPGILGEVSCFKKTSDSKIEIAFEGKTLLKVLDDLMMDDAFLKKQFEAGKDPSSPDAMDPALLTEKLFGQKGPIRAVAKAPLKAQFDYEKEAAPARKGMADLLKKHGAAVPVAIAPAGQGGALKSVRVAGAKMVHYKDDERGFHPLNSMHPGLTISIIAELPGAVLAVKEGKLTRAIADTGEDLLPKRAFDRTIHFPRLSNDKAAVNFDLELGLPSEKARGVKEVSGTLTYTVSGKMKEIDLGFAEFKTGARGKELGASLEKIEADSFQEGHQSAEVKLSISPDALQSMAFYDEGGKKLAVERAGYMGFGQSTTFTFRLKGKFPAKGRIIAQLHDDLKSFEVPFTVSNVDFLGRAMK